jgi:hypothetical protein
VPRGPLKPRMVAIKVPEDLAEFLDRLPNKSEFIRSAILSQLQMTCPLCDGSGTMPTGLAGHFKPILKRHGSRKCGRCERSEVIPADAAAVAAPDRARWEQFFHGGPFYCAKCYAEAEECRECGWHLLPTLMAEHSHSDEL